MDAERLIYTLADRLPVVEEEKVGNTSAKVECKAVHDTLAARQTEVKVHTLDDTLSELKGIETLDKLTLGDTQVKVNAKGLDYLIAKRKAEVKSEKLGDTSQRRK